MLNTKEEEDLVEEARSALFDLELAVRELQANPGRRRTFQNEEFQKLKKRILAALNEALAHIERKEGE